MSKVSEATQNHTRAVNIRNRCMPSKVTVKLNKPRLAFKAGVPEVMNSIGSEITTAKKGIKVVLVMKVFRGIFEANDRPTGIAHINIKQYSEETKRDALIMNKVIANFTRGLIDWSKPLLLLKFST